MHFAIAKLWGKLYFRSVNGTGVPALRSPLSNWINLVLLWLINTSKGGQNYAIETMQTFRLHSTRLKGTLKYLRDTSRRPLMLLQKG